MIDKEKILDFSKKKHENFSKQYEETKDYILDSLALEHSLLWSIISMGKLDIEQTKETCKWDNQEDSWGDRFYETSCKQSFSFFEGEEKYDDFKFCPYCGKEIDEVKE